mgnify:CR=1 FL=1
MQAFWKTIFRAATGLAVAAVLAVSAGPAAQASSQGVTDTEVTIEFEGGVGQKRLLLSFAPLEKIG